MSRARQLTGAQWSRTIFYQESYQIKRSIKLISTSSHLFPLGLDISREDLRPLAFQHNSDNRLLFLFLQVSIICGRLFGDYFGNQVATAKIQN